MISLPVAEMAALPVDERALIVLRDLLHEQEWNEHNYLLRYDSPMSDLVSEASAWLRGKGFIARTPRQSSIDAIFVTPSGHRAINEGLEMVRAQGVLDHGIHPLLERRVRSQFLLGEYEQAVFVAMKAIEVRVRTLAGFGNDAVGVSLMTDAFREGGPLRDPGAVPGEQVGTMNLFQGAYAVLRNPTGHREVDYNDVAEAAEAVATASLLMKILDRVEIRLTP